MSLTWYLGQNQRLFQMVMVLALVVLILALGNGFLLTRRPEPKYFWLAPDLRVLETKPLTDPLFKTPALVNWASRVLSDSFSLDYLHWRQKLNDLKVSFSDSGHTEFVKSLESAGHLKKIEEEKLIIRCQLVGAPVVKDTRDQGDRMTWILEAPVVISFYASSGTVTTQKLLVEMEAQRVPIAKKPLGLEMNRLTLVKIG
jgi:intracellular multiplication protein IcmL